MGQYINTLNEINLRIQDAKKMNILAGKIWQQYVDIETKYSGPYIHNEFCECRIFAIYDKDINAYILLSSNGYAYYFDRISSRIDKTIGIVECNGENLTIVEHCLQEQIFLACQEKYKDVYLSSNPGNTIFVFDDEYNVYVVFNDIWEENEYTIYYRFNKERHYYIWSDET
jgi:hypothetical protein